MELDSEESLLGTCILAQANIIDKLNEHTELLNSMFEAMKRLSEAQGTHFDRIEELQEIIVIHTKNFRALNYKMMTVSRVLEEADLATPDELDDMLKEIKDDILDTEEKIFNLIEESKGKSPDS